MTTQAPFAADECAQPVYPKARRPTIWYSWVRQRVPGTDGMGARLMAWRVDWKLVSPNGRAMCDSMGQGFEDKNHARISVEAVAMALTGHELFDVAEKGPGRKPKE